jgi:hypothetical protein
MSTVLTKVIFTLLALIWLTAVSLYEPFYAFICQMLLCCYGLSLTRKHHLPSFECAFASIMVLMFYLVAARNYIAPITPKWVSMLLEPFSLFINNI